MVVAFMSHPRGISGPRLAAGAADEPGDCSCEADCGVAGGTPRNEKHGRAATTFTQRRVEDLRCLAHSHPPSDLQHPKWPLRRRTDREGERTKEKAGLRETSRCEDHTATASRTE